MSSLQFPEKTSLDYFISIYLPGFLTALVFLSVVDQECWIDEIYINSDSSRVCTEEHTGESGKELDKPCGAGNSESNNTYLHFVNSGIALALYTVYLIAAPLLFGTLSDGLRHFFSRTLYSFISYISCKYCNFLESLRECLEFLRWRFPSKQGYVEWKKDGLSENIYLRRVDKSYFLYYTYEFFGNFSITIFISGIILFFEGKDITGMPIIVGSIVFIFCIFSMKAFWDDNNELCDKWDL